MSKNIDDSQLLLKRIKRHWQTSKTIDDYCQNFNKKIGKDQWPLTATQKPLTKMQWQLTKEQWPMTKDQWSLTINVTVHWQKVSD